MAFKMLWGGKRIRKTSSMVDLQYGEANVHTNNQGRDSYVRDTTEDALPPQSYNVTRPLPRDDESDNYTNTHTATHRTSHNVNRTTSYQYITTSFPSNINSSNASILSLSTPQPAQETFKDGLQVRQEIQIAMLRSGDKTRTPPPRHLLAGQSGADIDRIRGELKCLLGLDAEESPLKKHAHKWRWLYGKKRTSEEEVMVIFERAVKEIGN